MSLIGVIGAKSNYPGSIVDPFGNLKFEVSVVTVPYVGNKDLELFIYESFDAVLNITDSINFTLTIKTSNEL